MTAVSLVLTVLTVVVSVTKVVVVNAESGIGAAVVRSIWTNVFAVRLVLCSVAVDFAVTPPAVRYALVTTLEAGIVTQTAH